MPNVQPTYNEYLSPAIVGMRANMEPARVISRLCLPLAGMPFGVVATYGTSDDNARNVAAGGAYIGITGLDPTVRTLATNAVPDLYLYQDIMSIYTKGVIWVRAQVNASPGQPAFYDGNGYLTTVSGAGFATDSIAFTTNPVAGNTISIAGTTVTFVASGATGNQSNVGGSLAATLAALLSVLQGSADANLVKFTYALLGTSLNLTAATGGTAGNALAISTNVPGATVATPTATGGTTANTAIPNATFDSTATAGGLVKLRLN